MLFYPSWVHKVTFAPSFFDADICVLLFVANPFLNKLFAFPLLYDTLQDLEIFCNRCSMGWNAVLEFDDSTRIFSRHENEAPQFVGADAVVEAEEVEEA